VYLDLGKVGDIAEVTLNGKNFGAIMESTISDNRYWYTTKRGKQTAGKGY